MTQTTSSTSTRISLRFPVAGIAATGIPTVMLGAARKAIEKVTELAITKTPVASSGLLKERASAQAKLAKAEAVLRLGRLLLYDALSEAWQRTVGRIITPSSG